ncbi:MAG TPA: hypothetical protein VFV38_48825 [Ktedonobacteraceae bacterium]|nr:hypothetical protein [Ktedonobacteraceae bacterium]
MQNAGPLVERFRVLFMSDVCNVGGPLSCLPMQWVIRQPDDGHGVTLYCWMACAWLAIRVGDTQ